MSWLSDDLSQVSDSITGGDVSTATPAGGPLAVQGADTLSLGSLTRSATGNAFRNAADRLLGTNNPVDQVYSAIDSVTTPKTNGGAAPAPKSPGAGSSNGSNLWVHYAPIIAVAIVALLLTIHARFR